jgi:hypothetical protein
VNLFIGVVFDEFVATKTDLEGFGFLTERQREWVETQRLLLNLSRLAWKVKRSHVLHRGENDWQGWLLLKMGGRTRSSR